MSISRKSLGITSRHFACRFFPDLGGRRISDIRSPDLQRLVERIAAAGMSPSTIRNAINPVRAIYRRAVQLGEVPDDPTVAIVLPSVRSHRDRVAEPVEASRLLAEVPEADRAIWALGLYAGLRREEIMALRWCDLDFRTRSSSVDAVVHRLRGRGPRRG
jgi:integrase